MRGVQGEAVHMSASPAYGPPPALPLQELGGRSVGDFEVFLVAGNQAQLPQGLLELLQTGMQVRGVEARQRLACCASARWRL